MSRTIPAVNDNFIVTIGPRGQVMCCNPVNGDFIWGIDLVREFGAEIPFWYTGQCPLIVEDVAVLAPGGSALVIGVDCATGKILWQTPNESNWKMSHSSVMPMDLDGKKMYVYAAVGGICGIAADGDNVGDILWQTTAFAPSVVAPSPLVLDDGNILMTAGYGAGAMLFQIKNQGKTFFVDILQTYKPNEGISSEQQTPIYYNGHIFSILPKDAGPQRNQFVCCKPGDCMNILWTSGKTNRFGLGPYVIADDKFFILKDDGTLVIAEADVSQFLPLDETKIIDGQDAWGPIAIADGKLLMRDSKKMVCIDVLKR
jgi:outer membrane protein assembly factor BamB